VKAAHLPSRLSLPDAARCAQRSTWRVGVLAHESASLGAQHGSWSAGRSPRWPEFRSRPWPIARPRRAAPGIAIVIVAGAAVDRICTADRSGLPARLPAELPDLFDQPATEARSGNQGNWACWGPNLGMRTAAWKRTLRISCRFFRWRFMRILC